MGSGPIPVVLVGGGGHASDVLQAIEAANDVEPQWAVIGILADEEVDGRRFRGRGVSQIGTTDDIASVDARYVLAIGWPWTRRRVADLIGDRGEVAPAIVHPSADIGPGVQLGLGTVVLGHSHLSPMTQFGAHSLVSYGATIGHDTSFADFASVMPGANVSGDVVAGREVLVGTGATVREGVRLGDRVRIGSSAAVISDVAAGLTVVGVPARPTGATAP